MRKKRSEPKTVVVDVNVVVVVVVVVVVAVVVLVFKTPSFLDATANLYKRSCLSVCPSVRPFVGS